MPELDEVKKISKEVGKFLTEGYDHNDPESVRSKLCYSTVLLGKLAFAQAFAQKHLSGRIGEELEKLPEGMTATIAKPTLSDRVKEDQYWLDLVTLQDKEIHYQMEALRSHLSYLKSEMEQL